MGPVCFLIILKYDFFADTEKMALPKQYGLHKQKCIQIAICCTDYNVINKYCKNKYGDKTPPCLIPGRSVKKSKNYLPFNTSSKIIINLAAGEQSQVSLVCGWQVKLCDRVD